MVAIGPAIARELANGARDALRQGAAVVTGNQGEYIRNAEPASIYGKLQLAAARQACRRFADTPNRLSQRGGVLMENACRGYLDDIGYGWPLGLTSQVRGGLCGGFYRARGFVRYTLTGNFVGSPQQAQASVTTEYQFAGPVSVTGVQYFNPGAFGPRGVIVTVQTASGPSSFGQVTNAINGISNARFEGVFELQDGTLGDCGSPPPEIIPPTGLPGPRPVYEPFEPSPGNPIDIGVEINIDGSITFNFGTGPITIDPFAEDGGVGVGAPPGDVGDPGTPQDTGQGGEAEGEAGEGDVLVGLRINFASPPVGGNEYAPGVFRGVCYVYMGTPDGLDHDPAGAMLRDGQFIFAEKDNLTRWRVSANMGYDLRITPYYRPAVVEG